MKDQGNSAPAPNGKAPFPMAKLVLGIITLVFIVLLGSWITDKFQIWKWFK